MQVTVKSDSLLDFEFLINHTSWSAALLEHGSSLFVMKDTQYRYDPDTQTFVIFPNGADYHPTALKLAEFMKPLGEIRFPFKGRYDIATDSATVNGGIPFYMVHQSPVDMKLRQASPANLVELAPSAFPTSGSGSRSIPWSLLCLFTVLFLVS